MCRSSARTWEIPAMCIVHLYFLSCEMMQRVLGGTEMRLFANFSKGLFSSLMVKHLSSCVQDFWQVLFAVSVTKM